MNKRFFALYVALLFCIQTNAQPGIESSHWNFGFNASLDFNGQTLESNNIDSVYAIEGSASISDANTGQLLFYTDGTTAWDKTNEEMPNGFGMIGGNGTSTQAALIVPKPGSSTIYYLLSADQGGYSGPNQGVHYSVVDMSLNGGLGDVTTKNILLTPPPATEKLVGIKHCNGVDYWIITHPFNSNAFYAYLVTSAGIDTIPIISHAGAIEGNSNNSYNKTIGCLKGSPNGKKLACAVYTMGFEIFDFDNSSGVVNNPITLIKPNEKFLAYGTSFSPDNSKVYVSSLFDSTTKTNVLYQFDLSSGADSIIIASKTNILISQTKLPIGSLQLGLDSKLYVTFGEATTISVINNPNAAGLSCNLQIDALNLFQGTRFTAAMYGLPNFIDTKIPFGNVSTNSLCNLSNYMISANNQGGQYLWSSGDTTQSLNVTNFGNYWVSYKDVKGCLETDTFHIRHIFAPFINLLKDTITCSNSTNVSISINATCNDATSYLWSDGSNQPIHTISVPGAYWVDYTLADFCVSRDSFNYMIDSIPSVNIGRDTSTCTTSYSLSANASQSYIWNTGETTQQINATNTGNYWVTVTSQQGCNNTDSINIVFYKPPVVDTLHDSTECGNLFLPIAINATNSLANTYIWYNGSSSAIQTITNAGTYWVDYFFNHGCVSRDSFNVSVYPYPTINLGNDTTFCLGNLPLNAFNPSSTYLWNTGQTTPSIIAQTAQTYWVKVNTHSCLNSDTLVVFPELNKLNFLLPNIITPNNDGINDFIDFSIYQFSSMQLDVYNRWGTKVFESNNPACTWSPKEEDGTYFITLNYRIDCGTATQTKNLKGFVNLVR